MHLYRLSHPLGEWAVAQALALDTPLTTLCFDYSSHDSKLSVVEQLQGKSGWLSLSKLSLTSYQEEEHLIFSALTDDGQSIDDETCRKLFLVGASTQALNTEVPNALSQLQERRIEAQISRCMEANQQFFVAERDKLERWADDKILASEQALEETKARIKTLKRESRQADSLELQQSLQTRLRELERQQRRQRQTIFDVEDEIITRRDALIDALEQRLKQQIETDKLFTIRWSVI